MFNKVDLPHPLGPMIATISRWLIFRLTSRNASTTASPRLNVFETWLISITVSHH
jgi:hypothetical protein